MAAVVSMPALLWDSVSAPTKSKTSFCNVKPRLRLPPNKIHRFFTLFPTSHFSLGSLDSRLPNLLPAKATSSSVGNAEYIQEPVTKVKLQRSLSIPCYSTSLSLLGTGYREKVFGIIGVKVYAAGLYVNESIFSMLDAWRGRSAAEILKDSMVFDTIFKVPLEKSLSIVLVREVDGKTFWGSLDEAISPRIKSPSQDDETALTTFRTVFQGRPLKKGTFIVLTWIHPTKMLVCVSSDATPSSVDAKIESENVTTALFDVFLGSNPVSPSLKASVANGLEVALK